MTKVLIIHGLGGSPNGGWRPWLMRELSKLDVWACSLAMPDPDEPVLEAWLAEISRAVGMHPKDELLLVAHSLGTAAVLRYLEREGTRTMRGTVLVAGPSSPSTNEKSRPFLAAPFDYERIKEKTGKCVLIYGDKDEIVPPSHADAHARGLGAPVVMVKGAGHFNGSSGCFELPECLAAIKDML